MSIVPLTPGALALPGGGGKGIYPVGPGLTYPSVQAAVDALIADQGSEAFTVEQKITVAKGVYEPFRIEPDRLRPTSDARLIIEAEPDALPVLSGRVNPKKSQVGALIGNNVPFVTLRGLLFRDLIKGAVFGVNSHYGHVDRCIAIDCGNVGVWFYQADNCIVSNSVLINCDHLIATTLVKNVGIYHNTLFNDTGFSRENKKTYCIFLELQDDRGQGEEDTGRAYIYDNIIYSRSDFGILLYEKDVGHISSDYNDWYCPNTTATAGKYAGGLAEIRERHQDGSVSREFVPHLHTDPLFQSEKDWCMRTNQDGNSIADDPIFVTPAISKTSARVDLSLLKDSPVIGKGNTGLPPLPVWIDDPSFAGFDFLGKPRNPSKASSIGAHEQGARSDWFGGTVFAETNTEFTDDSGDDSVSDPSTDCETDAFSFDRAAAAYAHAVPAWFPKVHSGHFFVRDSRYYLYAQKRGLRASEMRRSTFGLSARLVEDSLKVTLAGRDVTDDATWFVSGYTFTLYHKGLDFDFDETSDVEVTAKERFWNSDTNSFAFRTTVHRWKLNESVDEYAFPSLPVQCAPIVVTDDLIRPGNQTGLEQEFRTFYDAEREEVRLELGGPKNLWANSDFSYIDEEESAYFEEYGVILANPPRDHRLEIVGGGFIGATSRFLWPRMTSGLDVAPVRGEKLLVLQAGVVEGYERESFVEQRVKINDEKPYTLSAHGCAFTTGDVSIGVELDFLDSDRQVMETHGRFFAPIPGNAGPKAEWSRFGLTFYSEATEERGLPDFSEYAFPLTTGIQTPAGAREVAVRFYLGTGDIGGLDAIQLEEGYRPGLYTRIPKGVDLTIEYEEADLRFRKLDDMSLQPVRNSHPRGFLAITPLPAQQFDTAAPALATTLSDVGWPVGRTDVLPWAKLDGFGNKYAHVPLFSTRERVRPSIPTSITPALAMPGEILIDPGNVVARQGSDGEIFSIEVLDENRNPYAFERVRATVLDPTGEFPGYLSQMEWGFPVRLNQRLVIPLAEAGAAIVRWIPPEPEEISYVGPKPDVGYVTVQGDSQRAGYVDTRYRVLRDNHGGVTLRDHLNEKIELEGDLTTGHLLGRFIDNYTVLQLKDYPVPGSFELFASVTGEVAATQLLETFGTPVPNRHYHVNYEDGIVYIPGVWSYDFRVEYQKRLAWVSKDFPRRVYLDGDALDLVTGDQMTLQYDAVLDLVVEALAPTGVPESTKTTYVQVPLIAQNRDREVPL